MRTINLLHRSIVALVLLVMPAMAQSEDRKLLLTSSDVPSEDSNFPDQKQRMQRGPMSPTAASRSAEVIDVLDYGVRCDGVSDNASALSFAISKMSPGATLYFPPASTKCLTSLPIKMPSDSTLYAVPGTVIIAPSATSASSPLLLSVSDGSNVLVYGPIFDGGGENFSNASPIAQVYNGNNVVFDHVRIQNTRGIGISFSKTSDSGVRDSRFVNVGNRYRYTKRTADQAQGVSFCCGTTLKTSVAQNGPGNTLTVSSNIGLNSGQLVTGPGVAPGTRVSAVAGAGTSVTLSASTFSPVASGATLSFTNNCNNFVTASFFEDVGLDPISASQQIDFTAIGNTMRRIGGPYNFGLGGGLYIANSDGVVVQGNTVNKAGGNAFDLYRVNNAVISGNRALLAGIGGITVASVTNSTIIGNTSLNNNQNRNPAEAARFIGQAGLILSGINGDSPSDNLTVVGNIFSDTQVNKTQNFGVQQLSAATVINLWMDRSNQITGNLVANFGGIAIGFSLGKIDGYIAIPPSADKRVR